MKIHEYNQMMKYLTRPAEGDRIEMAEGGSVKAAELSELLKEAGIEVSPKNIGRFTKTYGINKDPSRPAESGFYKEPTKKQLEKIKKDYDKKILKATGSTEAGKEAFKKREARAKELLREGKTQVEANKILQKEFNVKGMSSTLTKVSKELRDEGVKIKSGREAEVKTPGSKFAKERLKLQKATSNPYVEKKIRESKKAAGYGQIDLAHRSSMKQNKRLGAKLLSDTLGLDPPEVNRKIIKPIENELDKLYEKQSKLVKKIKKEGSSTKLRNELETINNQVEDIARKTQGRLQAIVVDPYNLKPITLGVDYSKSFGAGVVPTKPVSKMTPYDIELGTMQMKGQLPAVNKLYSGFSPELGKLGYEVLKDVVKGIPTPLGAVGLNVGLGVDPKETIDRVGIEAELALAPELVKQSARFGPTAQRILNLGLKAAPALRVARVLSPLGLLSLAGEAGYYTYKKAQETQAAINAMTPHQRELYESQMAGEALMGEAEFADGGRVGFKKGGMDRRTFMKIMGGLASLPVVGKMAKPIAKVAPVVADKSSEIFFSLAEKIKSLGKLIGDVDVDPRVERTYRYKNYELKENAFGDPDQSIITREIGDPDFAGYGQESMILKKGGTTEEGVKVIDEIEEVTVRPDGDGKMKDVEFGIEDIDDFGALE